MSVWKLCKASVDWSNVFLLTNLKACCIRGHWCCYLQVYRVAVLWEWGSHYPCTGEPLLHLLMKIGCPVKKDFQGGPIHGAGWPLPGALPPRDASGDCGGLSSVRLDHVALTTHPTQTVWCAMNNLWALTKASLQKCVKQWCQTYGLGARFGSQDDLI